MIVLGFAKWGVLSDSRFGACDVLCAVRICSSSLRFAAFS